MPYCSQCGKELSEGHFCPNCGAEVRMNAVKSVDSKDRLDRTETTDISRIPGFYGAFAMFWKRANDWKGRSSRSEFWFVQLWQILIILPWAYSISLCYSFYLNYSQGCDFFGEYLAKYAPSLFCTVVFYFFLCFLPGLALLVRRLHDCNLSGAFIFLGLIPVLGGLVLFIFGLLPPTRGTNKFGAQPGTAVGSNLGELAAPKIPGFFSAFAMFWKRANDWRGRSSRSEFWLVQLWQFLIMIPWISWLCRLFYGFFDDPSRLDNYGECLKDFGRLFISPLGIYVLLCLLPCLALLVRRLHDCDKSGKNIFLAFIPVVGPLILLFHLVRPSDKSSNQYGARPGYSVDSDSVESASVQDIPGFYGSFAMFWKRAIDWKGRSSRSEFWFVRFWQFLITLPWSIDCVQAWNHYLEWRAHPDSVWCGFESFGEFYAQYRYLFYQVEFYYLLCFFPMLALLVRRFHDSNHSGKLILLGLVPVVGSLILLVFELLPPTVGMNEYGAQPRRKKIQYSKKSTFSPKF